MTLPIKEDKLYYWPSGMYVHAVGGRHQWRRVQVQQAISFCQEWVERLKRERREVERVVAVGGEAEEFMRRFGRAMRG